MVITRLYTELAQSYMAHPCMLTFWEKLAWLVDSVGKILHFRLNQVSGGRDRMADLVPGRIPASRMSPMTIRYMPKGGNRVF